MSQMLELIKRNAVPAAVMRSAAKGALSVPAAEMIEILVFLTRNPVLGHDARMTLAAWDEASSLAMVSNTTAPQEVLQYFWDENNRRPKLMPALIENPRISEDELVNACAVASRELLTMMLASPRVHALPAALNAMLGNARLSPNEVQQIKDELGEAAPDADAEAAHDEWTKDHQAEIAAEEGKPFELAAAEEEPAAPAASAAAPVTLQAPGVARPPSLEDRKHATFLRVTKMNVAQRIKTAFLGNKEERSILIRDGARIVQLAVLSSPKLTEGEVEMFSTQKNVQENVLREIARNRRFMKSYTVIRNLVNNPKCPIDVSLTLIKNLLLGDLKALQVNKNVPDTLRQVAFKMYRMKAELMDAKQRG